MHVCVCVCALFTFAERSLPPLREHPVPSKAVQEEKTRDQVRDEILFV